MGASTGQQTHPMASVRIAGAGRPSAGFGGTLKSHLASGLGYSLTVSNAVGLVTSNAGWILSRNKVHQSKENWCSSVLRSYFIQEYTSLAMIGIGFPSF
ncbi:hypothetical protein CGMCC3_g5554 [Colletotrichum fructicola]|nr:uncharacterized protein CGMCC3_g5554 [Colletotrichum fructicola]KAE9578349.1 hypothetical protein CGMCC3_g5554 [Colletotrichum fructicola]